MFCFSEETIGEGTEVRVPSPSVSSAPKQNPPKKPASKAPMAEAQVNTAAETKAKRHKKNVQFPHISLKKHQASPSLSDVSYFLCRTFLSMLQ
jgi:hypothetical protein